MFYAFKYETKHKLVFDLYSDKHIPASSFSFFQLRASSRQISQAYRRILSLERNVTVYWTRWWNPKTAWQALVSLLFYVYYFSESKVFINVFLGGLEIKYTYSFLLWSDSKLMSQWIWCMYCWDQALLCAF